MVTKTKKGTRKRKPSMRQKEAMDNVVENRGNVSKAMRDAGYPAITAKNPKNLTESKAWADYMEEHLPDADLAKKHKELLNKKQVVLKNNNETGEIDTIFTDEIDVQAVKAALDMAYKLKGNYAPEKRLTVNVDVFDDKQIDKIARGIARRKSGNGDTPSKEESN